MTDFSKIPSPCYVLDERLLNSNLELINRVKVGADIQILLALKGFAMWSVFSKFKKHIDGVAASSLNEARLAFEEMGSLTHTYSPAFSLKDFEKILDYSSHVTFNSISQFNLFKSHVNKYKREVSSGLRVNPEYSEVKTELYNPASPGSRLGLADNQIPDILPDGVDGLHFHTLCESNSFALEKTLEAFEEKFGKYLSQVKWVNMGGGHLISEKNYDIDHLIAILLRFKRKYNLQVFLEPGAAFVWQAGNLVSTILDIVENSGIKTAILDVSFTAHMPDCLEMPYKPNIKGASNETKGKHVYRMGGNSCLAGDFAGNWSFEKELKIGDKIIFEDMMHYTMVKTTMFNGVHHPSIGILNEEGNFELVREFGYEDYKRRLS